MAGFPTHRPVFNLDGSQHDSSSGQNPGGPGQGGPIYHDAAAYPDYAMGGQRTYQPRPVFAPPLNTQYTGIQQIQYHGLAVASTADMSYAVHPQPGVIAIPSVLQVPAGQAIPHANLRNHPTYPGHQLLSASRSAPAVSMGGWMSRGAPFAPGNVAKPTGIGKKPRQQFSACTACRIRRVKCDLKDIRAEWEKVHAKRESAEVPRPGKNTEEGSTALPDIGKKKGKANEKPNLSAISRREDIQCTNCYNREAKCMYVS